MVKNPEERKHKINVLAQRIKQTGETNTEARKRAEELLIEQKVISKKAEASESKKKEEKTPALPETDKLEEYYEEDVTENPTENE